jgi:hypothetical protein
MYMYSLQIKWGFNKKKLATRPSKLDFRRQKNKTEINCETCWQGMSNKHLPAIAEEYTRPGTGVKS